VATSSLLSRLWRGFIAWRLRGYRVILSYPKAGVVRCEFAERRPMVYTLFEEEVLRRLGR
jgi:hypothetical protein